MSGRGAFAGRARVAAAAAAFVFALLVAAPASVAAGRPTVKAVIWPNYAVTVAPKSVPRGKVVFQVRNRESTPQQFAVDGVETVLIPPGGSASVTVTFARRGRYAYTLPDYQPNAEHGYKPVGGSITVT